MISIKILYNKNLKNIKSNNTLRKILAKICQRILTITHEYFSFWFIKKNQSARDIRTKDISRNDNVYISLTSVI